MRRLCPLGLCCLLLSSGAVLAQTDNPAGAAGPARTGRSSATTAAAPAAPTMPQPSTPATVNPGAPPSVAPAPPPPGGETGQLPNPAQAAVAVEENPDWA